MDKKIPKKFLVIGLGTFGYSVATELAKRGIEVIAVDSDSEQVEKISNFVTQAFAFDATKEENLKEIGIEDVDAALVAVGPPISESLFILLLLKELNVKEVTVKVLDPLHAKLTKKLGADRVIFPEKETAIKFVESVTSPNIFETIPLSNDYSLLEIETPKSFLNKTLGELNLRKNYKINVIGIKRKTPLLEKDKIKDLKEEINIAPGGEDQILEGDVLIVIGKTKDLERLKKL